MTIHAKENPVGLDRELLRLQNRINAIGWDNIDVYGKLYVNERNGKNVAEAYVGSGEYKDVFLNDKVNATFGFIVGDARQKLTMIKCNVKLICSCNLDGLYDSTERKDEEALIEVVNLLKPVILLPNEGTITTGLKSVFTGLSTDSFKYRDLHPWFNFSISFDMTYKA